MEVVLVRFKDNERRDIKLSGNKTVIGRRPDCGVRIQTSDVSRRHCEIESQDDRVLIRDLGSSNGTFVNGQRVEEVKLSPGDTIQVGPVAFTVQIDGEPTEVRPSQQQRGAASPAAPAAATAVSPSKKDEGDEDEEVFELTADDFDLEDAISALDELDDEEDLP
jgi:pSer/pThr/pTyr-binding forkhead associated (FHA) protein